MRVRRSFINWGIFLICLGAVPLAVQLNVMDRGTAGELVRLWPLIIVGIGLGLILRFTPLEALGGIVVAGTFGLLFGVLFAGGFPGGFVGCPGGSASGPTTTRDGSFSGSANVSLELSCADVAITRSPEDAWSVAVIANQTPTIDSSSGSLNLRSAANGAPFMGNGRENWQISLGGGSTLPLSASLTLNASKANIALGSGPFSSVSATFNASDARLDLDGASAGSGDLAYTLGPLNLTYNASSGTLILPAAMEGDITLNASSLKVCMPPEAAIRITYHETLSSQNFASAGLVRNGETWQTPNYTSGFPSLDISANVSSLTLDRSGGCQ
jgi:hypothetical protein